MPLSRRKIEKLWSQACDACQPPGKIALHFARLVEAEAFERARGWGYKLREETRLRCVAEHGSNGIPMQERIISESLAYAMRDDQLLYHRDEARRALKENK